MVVAVVLSAEPDDASFTAGAATLAAVPLEVGAPVGLAAVGDGRPLAGTYTSFSASGSWRTSAALP
jgi:hypothetical protein